MSSSFVWCIVAATMFGGNMFLVNMLMRRMSLRMMMRLKRTTLTVTMFGMNGYGRPNKVHECVGGCDVSPLWQIRLLTQVLLASARPGHQGGDDEEEDEVDEPLLMMIWQCTWWTQRGWCQGWRQRRWSPDSRQLPSPQPVRTIVFVRFHEISFLKCQLKDVFQ